VRKGAGRIYFCTAICAGRRFYQLLQPGLKGREVGRQRLNLSVHSVFRRVLNLCREEGLFSLVRRGTGNAPGFLVIDLPENINFITLGLRRGMPVSLEGEWLLVGEVLAVDCRRLRLWPGQARTALTWKRENLPRNNLQALHAAIWRWGVRGGMKDIISHPGGHPLAASLSCLARGLCYGRAGDLATAMTGILGYGPGLTPAGDDLVVGLLAAAGTGVEYQVCLPGLHRAIISNLNRTTTVSAHILRQAMAGDYHEYLQEVLHAVTRGVPEKVTVAARSLLGLGATSGTDMATGLYLAFTWQLENKLGNR